MAKENYSAEQVQILVSGYDRTAPQEIRRQQVKDLAAALMRKESSIIGKLVSMQLYQPLTYSKKGAGESKETLVTQLESLFDVPAGLFDSLAKANKLALMRLVSETVDLLATLEEYQKAESAELDTGAGDIDNMEVNSDVSDPDPGSDVS